MAVAKVQYQMAAVAENNWDNNKHFKKVIGMLMPNTMRDEECEFAAVLS